MKLFEYLQPKKMTTPSMEEKKDWLALAGREKFIHTIKYEASITDAWFDLYYAPIIRETVNLFQILPDKYAEVYNHDYGLLQKACDRTVEALKRCHDKMPMGSDAETRSQQRDHGIFAVFVAAITYDFWKVMEYACEISEVRYGVQQFDAMRHLNELPYLKITPKNIAFSRYLNSILAMHRITSNGIILLSKFPQVWNSLLQFWSHQPSELDYFIEHDEAISTLSPIAEQENIKPVLTIIPPEKMMKKLDTTIHLEKISTNQASSFIHGTEEGIFIALPEFLRLWEAVSHQPITEHDFFETLKKEGALIANQQAKYGYWHYYHLGQGHNKTSLRGVVLDKAKLISTIKTNDALHREI